MSSSEQQHSGSEKEQDLTKETVEGALFPFELEPGYVTQAGRSSEPSGLPEIPELPRRIRNESEPAVNREMQIAQRLQSLGFLFVNSQYIYLDPLSGKTYRLTPEQFSNLVNRLFKQYMRKIFRDTNDIDESHVAVNLRRMRRLRKTTEPLTPYESRQRIANPNAFEAYQLQRYGWEQLGDGWRSPITQATVDLQTLTADPSLIVRWGEPINETKERVRTRSERAKERIHTVWQATGAALSWFGEARWTLLTLGASLGVEESLFPGRLIHEALLHNNSGEIFIATLVGAAGMIVGAGMNARLERNLEAAQLSEQIHAAELAHEPTANLIKKRKKLPRIRRESFFKHLLPAATFAGGMDAIVHGGGLDLIKHFQDLIQHFGFNLDTFGAITESGGVALTGFAGVETVRNARDESGNRNELVTAREEKRTPEDELRERIGVLENRLVQQQITIQQIRGEVLRDMRDQLLPLYMELANLQRALHSQETWNRDAEQAVHKLEQEVQRLNQTLNTIMRNQQPQGPQNLQS